MIQLHYYFLMVLIWWNWCGSFVGTEEQGINLVLEGTDSDNTDANENFLLDDKTGDGNINLDGSDSDSADVGDDIINESGIDFSNKDVTITDSSGASGTIVKADIGTATSTVDTTSVNVGEYLVSLVYLVKI